ncbi:hypothetical protein [Clostridium botulinum]|uniref:hypothetical protein n=1 Tax=Clostridium botulinum TaxID=1491 RepID=UPI0013CCB3CB|nr:hypothetical protein [Clostridium botulinum]
MFGKTIKKYCNVCKKELEINVSSCLIGPAKTKYSHGQQYYVSIYCPKCNNHLSKNTEEKVLKLRKKVFNLGFVCFKKRR